MSIRLQLLVIALTTLVLPWAGCQYARELETTLRVSQENSLQAAADTIANALSAQSGHVFTAEDPDQPYTAALGDLYVYALHNQPLLDGYREDWGVDANLQAMPGDGIAARWQAGATERYLFLYVEVDTPVFRAEPNDVHPERDRFDRVDVTVRRADGALESFFLATGAPGPIQAQRIVKSDDGSVRAAAEPRVQAFWLQTSRGFHLEARIPRVGLSSRLWIEATAADGRAGFMGDDSRHGGRLFFATAGLEETLGTFIRAGTRVTVIDNNALKLGQAGTTNAAIDDDPRSATGSWYRRFMTDDVSRWPLQAVTPERLAGRSVSDALAGRPSAEWLRNAGSQTSLLSAASPIMVSGKVRGAVVLEQAGDQYLESRDRALAHLFNLTLLATALAVAIAFGVANWISVRVGRLRLAAETAVGSDGRIRVDMPESASGDEIGALARGFERLLARLTEHTQYLRTLGGKLSHELRTPLSIVRSSLDNLESEGIREDQRVYVTRAREGALRLQSILTALGAAARVEESIKQADRVRFDLKSLLQSTIGGYRDAFTVPFELDLPPETCVMHGAPDLVVQMLDKLIENAADFCTATGSIRVRLTHSTNAYEVTVSNDGPPIPPDVLGRLFESLFEHRPGGDDKPHFGLGLYIVRLIAEFHGGHAVAANRPAGAGAQFSVTLPLI